MKKIVSLLIALVLCLTAVAFAADSPSSSKVTDDLTHAEVVSPTTSKVTDDMTYAETIDGVKVILTADDETALAEIEKLAAAESVDAYFAGAVTEDSEVADLAVMLEKEEYDVYELVAIAVEGYSAEMGDLTVLMHFPTEFEDGAKLVVMIGFVTVDGIAWTAIEAEGFEGAVLVTMKPETVVAIQSGEALVAIVG